MADWLSKLLILIEGKDEASPQLKKAADSAHGLGAELTKIAQIASGVALGDLATQLRMSVSEHFKAAITEVETFGNQVFQLQQRVGITAQSASGLLSVFERFGVSSDRANQMLTFFSRGLRGTIDDTEGGALAVNSFTGVLAELGVSATDAAGKFRPVDQVLAEVQDRMSKFATEGDNAARLTRLFGRAGADLAPIFNLTSQEFEDLRQEALRLGVTLSQDNVNQIRQLTMAHHDLDEAVRGLTIQLGLAFVPVLTEAAKGVADFAKSFNQSGEARQFLEMIDRLAGRLADLKKLNDELNAKGAKGAQGKGFPDEQAGAIQDSYRASTDAAAQAGRWTREQVDKLGEAKDLWQRALGQGGLTFDRRGNPELHPEVFQKAAEDLAKEAQAAKSSARQLAHMQQLDRELLPTDRGASQVADLTRNEQLKRLDQAEIYGKRGLQVAQHELNVLQRDNLDLVKQAADAELGLIPIKQQQAALELQLLQTQDRRGQIERETATARARLAAMPASAALQDNQYQQQLLQARIRAGALSGQGVNPEDIQELVRLRKAEPGLEVPALMAGHEVTKAERVQQAGQLGTDIATAPTRMALADVMIDAAKAQHLVDEAAAAQRTDLLTKTQEIINIERQRRDLEDKIFDIMQKRLDLSGATVNVTMTVNEATGAPDYAKLVQDLADAVMRTLGKVTSNLELPAPSTVPGGGF